MYDNYNISVGVIYEDNNIEIFLHLDFINGMSYALS